MAKGRCAESCQDTFCFGILVLKPRKKIKDHKMKNPHQPQKTTNQNDSFNDSAQLGFNQSEETFHIPGEALAGAAYLKWLCG